MRKQIEKIIYSEQNSDIAIEFKNSCLVTFVNPFSYLLLRKREAYWDEIDLIFSDGIVLGSIIRVIIGKKILRRSFDFSSLANPIFEKCLKENKSLYFVGAKGNEIEQAVINIKENISGLNIIGYSSGYFSDSQHRQNILDTIVQSNPSVVIVGMGTPKQEEFLINLKKIGWKGVGFTCGGFFHQTARKYQYYPRWIDRLSLRWIYRIYDEPKLFKRYAFIYPKSIFLFILDCINEDIRYKNL